jgi:hypothetical protein
MINPRQTPRRPNLFILGAAKCGTTSLWHYLRQHPDIFMSAWKEPSLFSDTYNAVPNIVDYMDIFAAAGDRKVVGEASVAYLTTARAPAALQAFCPDAKYLVILRHPADRAYSLYHHMRYRGHEFAPTFELALRLENFRMGRPRFWSHATHIPWNFLYFTSGLFGRQISRYLEFIPRERFYFLTLSELEHQPSETMANIFRFLAVDDSFRPSAERQNVGGQTARHPLLKHLLVQRLPRLFRRYPRGTAIPPAGAEWIRRDTMPVPPISAQTRARLACRYEEDLQLLPALTGLSLDRL